MATPEPSTPSPTFATPTSDPFSTPAPDSDSATPTSSADSSEASPTTSLFSSDPSIPPTPTSSPSIETIISSEPLSTEVVTGSGPPPTSVVQVTSIITTSPTSGPERTSSVVVVTQTSIASVRTTPSRTPTSVSSAAASSSEAASLQSNGKDGDTSSGPLSPGATVAIAVVIPVVVVSLLVLAGVFLWRKRKQKKVAQETRRKEVEEYGYNPNNDPTLPAVGTVNSHSPEMTEDSSGYRGWGNNNAAGSARKPSTNLSGGIGVAVSDDGTHPSAGSPGNNTSEGGNSAEPLVDGNNGLNGAMTGAGAAAGAAAGDGAMKRGPSNASSSYSAGGTDNSEDPPTHDHGYDTNYSQYTPYRPGATNYDDTTQPVIQDVSARRNTRIENPSVVPKPGNSGISANF